MDFFEALQILLIFPSSHAQYKSAHEFIVTLLKSNNVVLDKESEELLRILLELVPPLDFTLLPQSLQKLPNLNTENTSEKRYQILLDYLIVLAEKKKLKQNIVTYLTETISRLQPLLDQSKDKQSNILCRYMTHLMLLYHYGQNGLNGEASRQTAIKQQIKQILSGEKYDLAVLRELKFPLLVLKKHLYAKDRSERLWARDIVEELKLPLELAKMLSLGIDGITTDEKQIAEDRVLVIGPTGSGKSALINHLWDENSQQYVDIYDSPTGSAYLIPKPGLKLPVRSGHGLRSETLFPSVISMNKEGFSLCDCPGFGDTRQEDEAICASLGVPLAVSHAKKLRAVIIVVEWNMFSSGRGMYFYDLSLTLFKLFKKLFKQYLKQDDVSRIPLLFAITKPPEPSRNKRFDVNLLKRSFLEKIVEIQSSFKEEAQELQIKKTRYAKLDLELSTLLSCLAVPVENFLHLSVEQQKELIGTKTASAGFLNRLLIGISGKTKEFHKGLLEQEIIKQTEQWKEKDLDDETVLQLGGLFRKVISLKTQERLTEIQKQRMLWIQKSNDLKEKLITLRDEIEKIEGHEALLSLLLKMKNNIFIIRGFKELDNEKDHRNELLECLAVLRKNNIELNKDEFSFSSSSNEYAKVREWIKRSIIELSPIFSRMLLLHNCLKQEREKSKELWVDEIDQAELFCHMRPILAIEDTEVKLLAQKIATLEAEKRMLDERTKKIDLECNEYQKQEKMLLEAKEIEYGSNFHKEARYLIGSLLGAKTTWTYTFPNATLTDVIPIQRYETSCTIDEQGKLVFTSKILEDSNNMQVSSWAVCKESSSKYNATGKFIINKYDPTEGTLSVTYESNSGGDGIAGVRVFILPRDLPENKERLAEFEARIKGCTEEKAKLLKQIEKVEKEIILLKDRLSIRKLSLDSQQSFNKMRRIIILIHRLELKEKDFIEKFFPQEKEYITWLKSNIHLLETLSTVSPEGWIKIGTEKQIMDIVLGLNVVECLPKQNDQTQNTIKIPKIHFDNITEIFKRTGLSVFALQIILSVFNNKQQARHPYWHKFPEILLNKPQIYHYLLGRLKEICLNKEDQIRTTETCLSLINFDSSDHVNEFLIALKEIRANKILEEADRSWFPDEIGSVKKLIQAEDLCKSFGRIPKLFAEQSTLELTQVSKLETIFESDQEASDNARLAFQWCKAQEKENTGELLYSLGLFCASGRGVEKDIKFAQEYFHRSCTKGNTRAQEKLKFLSVQAPLTTVVEKFSDTKDVAERLALCTVENKPEVTQALPRFPESNVLIFSIIPTSSATLAPFPPVSTNFIETKRTIKEPP